MSSIWRRLFLIVATGLIFAVGLDAQTNTATLIPKNNSPLSRFGLGDPVNQFYSAAGGMAGVSAAWDNPFHLNLQNPASLTRLQATALEVGLYGRYARLRDQQTADDVWSGNLNYFALGFPLRNPINQTLDRQRTDYSLGMAFSLQPVTQVGYNLALTNMSNPELVTTDTLKGTGGTYQVNWSNGFRYKNLAVGVNLGYLFGKITNTRLVEFDSLPTALVTEFLEDYSVSGLTWSAGFIYTIPFYDESLDERIKSGKRIAIGAFGNGQTGFNTNGSQIIRRFSDVPQSFRFPIVDTLGTANEIDGRGQLPASLTVGLSYEHVNNLFLSLEFGQTWWNAFRNDAQDDSLEDSYRIAAGAEYIPNIISYNNYWSRVRYRLGFRYETDPRTISAEQARLYGLSFGFGLPIIRPREQTSYVNMAFEIGKFGVPDVLDETFIQFTLGFTLNDNTWFFKRKFN